MTTKWLLNLVLATLAVALAAFVYFTPREAERGTFPLLPIGAGDVTSIRVEREKHPPYVIELSGGEWHLTHPLSAPAEPYEVQRLLAILSARSPQRMVPAELSRFDLDAPPLRIAFNDHALGFGMVNALTREQYVLGRSAIYTIEPRYTANVPDDVMRVVRHRLLPQDAQPTRITLPAFTLTRAASGWSMTPAPAGLAEDAAERLARAWTQAKAERVARAGAEPALGRVRIEIERGDAVVFDVLLRDPALVLRRPDYRLEFTLAAGSARLLDPRP